MKFLPKIEFREEKKTKEAGRIEEILEELKKGEKWNKIDMRPGSQVAKATLCKRVIRECKSRPGLKMARRGDGKADIGDLKSPDRKVVRVRLPPSA